MTFGNHLNFSPNLTKQEGNVLINLRRQCSLARIYNNVSSFENSKEITLSMKEHFPGSLFFQGIHMSVDNSEIKIKNNLFSDTEHGALIDLRARSPQVKRLKIWQYVALNRLRR